MYNLEPLESKQNKRTSKKTKRVWTPVKRAEVFQDRRLKRQKTRGAATRKAIEEHS